MNPTAPLPGSAGSAVIGGLDVDRIAAAVATCPSVVALHPGAHGAVATLLPGRRVAGVRVLKTDGHAVGLEIAVTARYGAVLARVGDEVRTALAGLAPDLPAEVTVADIA